MRYLEFALVTLLNIYTYLIPSRKLAVALFDYPTTTKGNA